VSLSELGLLEVKFIIASYGSHSLCHNEHNTNPSWKKTIHFSICSNPNGNHSVQVQNSRLSQFCSRTLSSHLTTILGRQHCNHSLTPPWELCWALAAWSLALLWLEDNPDAHENNTSLSS